ncbi:uncharacterized protein LOC130644983 isoform X1 [Hydractinia symbiolongicarpus]|uniref:uncharacterized protein LOC130644983 isoform X1 n=1 Tax=Hydractinia symbiolongicarpus TaxID=13093 RepID=UPI00254B5081|nr:uncharacterized protein LOC130644983 isoform X1 [Hydractinia symbiolongicarpus]
MHQFGLPIEILILSITNPGYNVINTPPLMWGRKKEKEALADYTNISCDEDYFCSSLCINPIVVTNSTDIGLVLKATDHFFGVSPDAVINCSCCGLGVVEIKCPYSLRETGLQKEIVSNKFYIKKSSYGTLSLDNNYQYYSQVQHKMYVCGVSHCDFVVWTPIEFVILRIYVDQMFIAEMVKKCSEFWMKCILPELFTRKLENNNENDVATTSKIIKHYCICNPPLDGDMVGCDHCDRWYHIQCINLKKIPRSKVWYCKDCKKKKTTQ